MQFMVEKAVTGYLPASLPHKKAWHGPCPFAVGDLVESRTFTEGYRDAWFLSRVLAIEQEAGPPAYTLTLKCVDFDEDEPFQCPLYANPGVAEYVWELMVRPPPPTLQPPGPKRLGEGRPACDGLTYKMKRSYAIGDAVEYLCNCAWWMGRVSEIDGQRASVWWRPPPFGEGGEEVNISFDALRPAMVWDRGQWSFPGHPKAPLGVLLRPGECEPVARVGPRMKSGGMPGAAKAEAIPGPAESSARKAAGKKAGAIHACLRKVLGKRRKAVHGEFKPGGQRVPSKKSGASPKQDHPGGQEVPGEKGAASPGAKKADETEVLNITRYGRVVKPEVVYNAKGPEPSPRKRKGAPSPKSGKGKSGKTVFPRYIRNEDIGLPPYSRCAVNERLSRPERMGIARKALESHVRDPDKRTLEDAMRAVAGCRPPTFNRKGAVYQTEWLLWKLRKWAKTGEPYSPAEARTPKKRKRPVDAKSARGEEGRSFARSGGAAALAEAAKRTPEERKLSPAWDFPGSVKTESGRQTAKGGSGGKRSPGTSPGSAEWWQWRGSPFGTGSGNAGSAFGGTESSPDRTPGAGENGNQPAAGEWGAGPGVRSTPPDVEPGFGAELPDPGGVLRVWEVDEAGGVPLEEFRAPWDLDPM